MMTDKNIKGSPYPFEVNHDEVHLLNIWHLFYKFRLVIILIVLFFTIAFIGISFLLPKYYMAEVMVIPAKSIDGNSSGGSRGNLGGLASLAGINVGGGSQNTLMTTMSLLESRFFVYTFVNKHNVLPILFEDKWNKETKNWKSGIKPGPGLIFKEFNKIYSISEDVVSTEIRISIEWKDANLAQSWVTLIVNDINVIMKKRDQEEAAKSLEFLYDRLSKVTLIEMKPILLNLISSETQKLMLADIRDEYALETIDPAILPEKSTWPNKILFAIIGLLSGILVAIVVVIAKNNKLHNSVESKSL